MFLFQIFHVELVDGFPRIRGDVPPIAVAVICKLWFSPHTRGCSATLMEDTPKGMVFPAYAGMFRS